jgi:hypothetical protein
MLSYFELANEKEEILMHALQSTYGKKFLPQEILIKMYFI